jgi:Protein of unknown function (DUF1559)
MPRSIRLVMVAATVSGALTAVLFCTQPTSHVVAQPAEKLPADLALVPGDAVGFAHIRVADLWKSDGMKDFRKIIDRAGPNAFATLDADFTPAPSTIDRITTVLLPFKDKPEPRFVTILAFSKSFDADAVKKRYMPKAEELKANGKAYSADKLAGVSAHFPNDTTIVFGDADTVPQFLEMSGKASGSLAESLRTATTKPVVACVNVQKLPLPPELADQLPLDLKPLLKAETITLSADTGKETTLTASVGFASDADAVAGEKALRKAAEMGRVALTEPRRMAEQILTGTAGPRPKMNPRSLEDLPQAVGGLAALGGINTLDEYLAELPLKTAGKNVTATVTLPPWTSQYMSLGLVSAGVALPAVQKVRNAAARQQAMNNLKQIGLAMHNYHDTHGVFPPSAICDKKGKKLLSWRVAILPYIEQDNLYRQFKLDEPWDSEHNKKFSDVAIKVYSDPRVDNSIKPNHTYYKVFVGGGSPFDVLQSKRVQQISDGTSNTLMVAAAGDPVPWAKPDDFDFDPKKELPDLKKPFGELLVLFCDGSVRMIRPEVVKDFDKLMKLLIQADDGMVIPNDF